MTPDRSDYFAWGADVVVTQCAFCKHLGKQSAAPYCTAFPGGIPANVLANEHDHRKPWIDPETGHAGDEGVPLAGSILFEPRPDASQTALQTLYRHLDSL